MNRFVSLTNKVMSFWNKLHNNGPNDHPWGQPRDMLDHSRLIVPSFTWLYLSFRNDRIRSNDWLVNLYALSFLMTKLWHRESKASLMSVEIVSILFYFLKLLVFYFILGFYPLRKMVSVYCVRQTICVPFKCVTLCFTIKKICFLSCLGLTEQENHFQLHVLEQAAASKHW